MGAEPERQQEVTKTVVRLCRVILDDVARYDDAVSAPVPGSVVGEDLLKRSPRVDATQAAFGVGEQMRVRQVQDPNTIVLTFRGRLNRRSSRCQSLVTIVLRLVRTVFVDADVLRLFVR